MLIARRAFAVFLLTSFGPSGPQPHQVKSPLSPRLQIFRSPDNVFKFSYPSSYTLVTGEEDRDTCGGDAVIACVEFPEAKYSGTTFVDASFRAREVDGASTEAECMTSPMRAAGVPEFDIPTKDPKRVINGVRFLHGISSSVGAGTIHDTDLYRAFRKGKCYELSFELATTNSGNYDPGTIKEFTDEDRVRRELLAILDSFRFLK